MAILKKNNKAKNFKTRPTNLKILNEWYHKKNYPESQDSLSFQRGE